MFPVKVPVQGPHGVGRAVCHVHSSFPGAALPGPHPTGRDDKRSDARQTGVAAVLCQVPPCGLESVGKQGRPPGVSTELGRQPEGGDHSDILCPQPEECPVN